MSNAQRMSSALPGLALALLALGCGSPVEQPGNGSGDAYHGVVDGSALAAPFQPGGFSRTVCQGATSCYLPQTGFVDGHPIAFYNALAVQTANLPSSGPGVPALSPSVVGHNTDGTGGFSADTFRNASCTPGPEDPVRFAFSTATQAPVLEQLPTASANTRPTAIVYPIAAVYDVTGTSGQCNDIKNAASIGRPGAPGLDGSVRGSSPIDYEVWLPMDPGAAFFDLTGKSAPMPIAWYRGLQLGVAGGPGNAIPQDARGNFLVMNGALVNPSSSKFSQPTDANAVVLPFAPGEAGYSPIVVLHSFTAQGTHKVGDYRGICQPGQTCPANYIATADYSPSSFNTIFIVTSVQ